MMMRLQGSSNKNPEQHQAIPDMRRHFCGDWSFALHIVLHEPQRNSGFSTDVHVLEQDGANRHLQSRMVDVLCLDVAGRSADSGFGRNRNAGRALSCAQLFHGVLRLLVRWDLRRLLPCSIQNSLAGAKPYPATDHHERIRSERGFPAWAACFDYGHSRNGDCRIALSGH